MPWFSTSGLTVILGHDIILLPLLSPSLLCPHTEMTGLRQLILYQSYVFLFGRQGRYLEIVFSEPPFTSLGFMGEGPKGKGGENCPLQTSKAPITSLLFLLPTRHLRPVLKYTGDWAIVQWTILLLISMPLFLAPLIIIEVLITPHCPALWLLPQLQNTKSFMYQPITLIFSQPWRLFSLSIAV